MTGISASRALIEWQLLLQQRQERLACAQHGLAHDGQYLTELVLADAAAGLEAVSVHDVGALLVEHVDEVGDGVASAHHWGWRGHRGESGRAVLLHGVLLVVVALRLPPRAQTRAWGHVEKWFR